jgi:hypothetical protein
MLTRLLVRCNIIFRANLVQHPPLPEDPHSDYDKGSSFRLLQRVSARPALDSPFRRPTIGRAAHSATAPLRLTASVHLATSTLSRSR